MNTPRMVMHVDFDYFYAQCEEVRNPTLKAKPLIVCVFSGRTEDSGVVSTANYVARSYGVRSGIPIRVAKSKLNNVPDAVFLPLDMAYYSEISDKAMLLIQSFASQFEQVGIDECFIDVSDETRGIESAEALASRIKEAIRTEIKLTCSIGVAPNKLLAKIASDFKKPDGLTVIDPQSALGFIADLEVEKISGIGPKTSARLGEMGVKTIRDLEGIDRFKLVEEFGRKTGAFLYNAARGMDDEPVADTGEKKQIARIMTLKEDASSGQEMADALNELCRSVFGIARTRDLSFKSVGVIVILNNLDQRTKSKALKIPSTDFDLLLSTTRDLLAELMSSGDQLRVRRLGIRISELQDTSGQNTMSQFMG
jgi:DNA polymerase IV (DinB-like DNA polymerase)